jgi:hypothetical protein
MKKINNKGQLFVLDVIFAIIIVFLLFILLSKWVDHQIYNSISQRQNKELEYVGGFISRKIMTDPNYLCYVSFDNTKSYISGCLGNNLSFTKEALGVPDGYNCNLTTTNLTLLTNDCNTTETINEDFYKIDLKFAKHNNREMTLSQYQTYLDDLSINSGELTLVVWKT